MFRHVSSSNTENGFDGINLGSGQAVAIDRQKQTDTKESCSFVAVNEGVVFCDPVAVRSCKFGKGRGRLICIGVAGTSEGRLEKAFIPRAPRTSEFRKAFSCSSKTAFLLIQRGSELTLQVL